MEEFLNGQWFEAALALSTVFSVILTSSLFGPSDSTDDWGGPQ